MGVTISHKLAQTRPNIAPMLDRVEKKATAMQEMAQQLAIKFSFKRYSPISLYIDIGNCETLAFNFKTPAQLILEASPKPIGQGWSYEYASLTKDGKRPLEAGYEIEKYPQNEILYTSDFCKTQFAHSIIEHQMVAELIREVASCCTYAEVNDEGEYYHSLNLGDAVGAIGENGALIESIGRALAGQGFEAVAGGKTKVGRTSKAKKA
jgi:hypothetical protein